MSSWKISKHLIFDKPHNHRFNIRSGSMTKWSVLTHFKKDDYEQLQIYFAGY